jgi:hypothetical protein
MGLEKAVTDERAVTDEKAVTDVTINYGFEKGSNG